MEARGAMNFQPRITRMGTDKTEGREAQGCAWASQARDALSNPFASELARDSKTHRSFCSANAAAFLRLAQDVENRKNTGLRLVSKQVDEF